jgi:hypothetical protein
MNTTPFSAWFDPAALLHEVLPAGPVVVQVKLAHGLVAYPRGQSAMVFYGWAPASDLAALVEGFPDAVAHRFRFRSEPESAAVLAALMDRFLTRFGATPRLHEPPG